MRGEFIRGDGLVIPNNVSIAGAMVVLEAAFRHESKDFYAALVRGSPTLDMTVGDMVEPVIGENGYARIKIDQDSSGWQVLSTSDSEAYIESGWLEWVATSGPFSEPIQRVAILGYPTYNIANDIFCLSVPMANEITITPATPQELRRFKYRFYL